MHFYTKDGGEPNGKAGTDKRAGLIVLLGWLAIFLIATDECAVGASAPANSFPATNNSQARLPLAEIPGGLTNSSPSNNIPRPSNFVSGPLTMDSHAHERFVPRSPRNGYEAQLALARLGFSPGCLDGVIGSQTRAAIRAYQEKEGLPVSGQLDSLTKARLRLTEAPERNYVVTTNDLARLLPVGTTWLAKSQQKRLDYENILELVSEKGQAHPSLIRSLNPSVSWTNVAPGTILVIPKVESPTVRTRASLIRIRISEKTLQAFDERTNILAHFPCSIPRLVEKRPIGELIVETAALNPSYRFDPEIFPESAEARKLGRILFIPPGPNNPVGTAWIGLNRPGYGIHGTPHPEDVGRTESHGCFRLANWNAEYLAQLVRLGTRVSVEP